MGAFVSVPVSLEDDDCANPLPTNRNSAAQVKAAFVSTLLERAFMRTVDSPKISV